MSWWRRRRVYVDDLAEPHDGRFLLVFLVLFVAVLGGVYVVGYVAAGDKVPSRTTVGGVAIGSLSREHAREVLDRTFATRLEQPLTARAGGRSLHLVPAAAGVTFDVEATLDRAMGGTDWNPHHMLEVVDGGGAVDPIYRADPIRLGAALRPLADRVERDPVDAAVTVKAGRPVLAAGATGRELDASTAAEAVVAALQDGEATVALPLRPVSPSADLASAQTFLTTVLRPALASPVRISVGGTTVPVTPEQFGVGLRVSQDRGHFALRVQPAPLWAETHALLALVPGRPVDARVVIRDGRPVVTPGHSGTVVSPAAWAKAVFTAATDSANRRASAAVTEVDPGLTTAEARSFGITTNLGAASTSAPVRLNGVLTLAARSLDGTVVLPGKSFSYVHEAGSAGSSTVLGPLGGATQTAAERANMTITRWPLISPTGHDLGFRNPSDHPVLLHCSVLPHRGRRLAVVVQLWGSASS